MTPKRILVLQQRQIGDVILTTPALAALRMRYPSAEIHFCTEKSCAQLIYGNPHIDKIIELDKKAIASPVDAFAWYWCTARGGYDMVIDFQQLPRCRWLALFSGAKIRLASKYRWYNRLFYNVFAASSPHGYSAWNKVNALSVLGVQNRRELPKIYLTEAELQTARTLLKLWGLQDGERLVTVDVTHRRATCKWPAAYFARAVELMSEADRLLKFLIFFALGEEEQAREVFDRISPAVRDAVIFLPKPQPIRIIAACISLASLHFGNCSAPQHMAAAVGTPSCIIVGAVDDSWRCPTDEHVCVSADIPCRPCASNECRSGKFECLTCLIPHTAVEAALKLLHTPPRR